jgi:hypothetical protein
MPLEPPSSLIEFLTRTLCWEVLVKPPEHETDYLRKSMSQTVLGYNPSHHHVASLKAGPQPFQSAI